MLNCHQTGGVLNLLQTGKQRGKTSVVCEYDDKKNSKLTTFNIDRGVKVVRSSEII